MKLIDADALLEDIGEEPMNWTNSPEEIQEYIDWKQTVAIINSASTIEAEPIRHGHWEILNAHEEDCFDIKGEKTWATEARCSQCGLIHSFIENHMAYAYCPECGAKMDEVSE